MSTRSSSFLVPDALMLMVGNILLSTSFLSRCSSMLPVPLNSSKITSSILLPVSTSAVAMIVRLPPPSILRAAPKNLLGFWSALESRPPERTLPLAGITALYALASLVIESRRITTFLFVSTSLFALSMTISATCRCLCGGSSNVELIISSASTCLLQSVTSSGLSSMSRIIRWISLWLCLMPFAMD